MNPLLSDYKFIPFAKLTTKDLEDAINERLNLAEVAFTHVVDTKIANWELLETLFYPAIYDLNQAWGILMHLKSVKDTQELRDIYAKLQPKITEFFTKSWQNKYFYKYFKSLSKKCDSKPTITDYYNNSQLKMKDSVLPATINDPETQKVIANELRDFKLSGIELSDKDQIEFRQIQKDLNTVSTKFEQNVLDATDKFVKYCTIDELNGVPTDILTQFNEAAKLDGKDDLYKVTLKYPSYMPIMQFCSNRGLREELYYNYVTRASDLGDKKLDNSMIIPEILNLRLKKAGLLGFSDYVELSLFNKMAKNNKEVLDFLYNLAAKSKDKAYADYNELQEFALSTDKINTLNAWDIAYYTEKLQQQKYSYSTEELRQYFQLPIVMDGLFKLIYQLYKVEFRKNLEIPTWDMSVETYDVLYNDKVIGYFYCDLYARNSKQSGAWMNSAQDRFMTEDIQKNPMAYIICNFQSPLPNKPCLLDFDEVQTLFHETGHALHHLLTKVNHFSISGINNVEWDAVELPSQFMEYFTWNYKILTTIGKHVDSGSVIPLELFNKLLQSRFFMSGMQMMRQLEFAIFDMLIHDKSKPDVNDYMAVLTDVRNRVAVMIPPAYNRFPQSFSHIFAGGYAAGYYSYKWAEVLATDIFAQFDAIELEQYSELGEKFLTTILSKGGVDLMLDNFVAFMGRKPEINALLKYSGII